MSTLEIDIGDLHARSVEFTATEVVVTLADGRRSPDEAKRNPEQCRGRPRILLRSMRAADVATLKAKPDAQGLTKP